jgi:transposase
MKNKEFVGIDVSKIVLDVFILSCKFHFTVPNSPQGYAQLLQIVSDHLNDSFHRVFFCFENTGRYSRLLSVFLQDGGFNFAALDALDLKRSMGLTRGKSDKKDARTIALYAWRRRDELAGSKLAGPVLDQLRQLLTLRDKLIKHRTVFKNTSQDLHDGYFEGEFDFIKQRQKSMISHLQSEIDLVDKEINRIITLENDILINYNLLRSIPGIGNVLAVYLIALTHNFTRFDNPRKFACYAGIAPFEYSSGTSVKGKTKVHPCANKHIKSLLNMAAMASIQLNGEYKMYYQRRLLEGRNKMSTLNIVRNKLVFRAFAIVKRGTPYVDLHKFAA